MKSVRFSMGFRDGLYGCNQKGNQSGEYVPLAVAERLQEQAELAASLLMGMANVCDSWASRSRNGGWSTHQVDQNIAEANRLRRCAAEIRAAITEAEKGS